jgi:peptidyl-dipeptidase A
MKTTLFSAGLLILAAVVLTGCAAQTAEQKLQRFISAHVAQIDPMNRKTNEGLWLSETTGDPEAFDELKKLRLEMTRIYSNKKEFAFLKQLRQSGQVRDPLLVRQMDRLYYAYLANQTNPELLQRIVRLSTAITEKYNTFRGTIDANEVTMTEIYRIMTTEKNSQLREKAWRASKQVSRVIIDDFLTLVRLRNRAARQVGFNNYHTLAVATAEQSVPELDDIFEQLNSLTRQPYEQMKAELDQVLAADYGISPDQLMPWHYHDPFFQRSPLVYKLDLDVCYKDTDVRRLAERYYAGVGLPVDSILAASDLYDRPGKNPHAFAVDIDRHGDVRVLCNLDDTERWMETILHELGHAIYSKYHNPQVPYLLREPAHSFTTEAIAMFFGRLSRNAAWMQQMLGLSSEQRAEIEKVAGEYMRLQQLIFARWAMVMYNFEKQLYADPDQDLNCLWWDLVEKYQLVRRPPGQPDAGWVSKLHFTVAPCYYHNYMLGELLASQLHQYFVRNVLKLESDKDVSYIDCPELGRFLREKVFEPAAVYHWNQMIINATGEPLTPKYFVAEFVQ